MKPARFVLVRHGETAANREFRYIGSRDDPLTARGEEQAQAVATALSIFPLNAIYSSPRRRAFDTALAIALPQNREVIVCAELRESSFGLWEGYSRAEVLAAYPAELAAWEADAEIAPPEGESLAEMHHRVALIANELASNHEGETIALVSHVGPIKAIICTALGVPPATARRLFLDPATISVVDWSSSGSLLRLYNQYTHLGLPRWLSSAG